MMGHFQVGDLVTLSPDYYGDYVDWARQIVDHNVVGKVINKAGGVAILIDFGKYGERSCSSEKTIHVKGSVYEIIAESEAY